MFGYNGAVRAAKSLISTRQASRFRRGVFVFGSSPLRARLRRPPAGGAAARPCVRASPLPSASLATPRAVRRRALRCGRGCRSAGRCAQRPSRPLLGSRRAGRVDVRRRRPRNRRKIKSGRAAAAHPHGPALLRAAGVAPVPCRYGSFPRRRKRKLPSTVANWQKQQRFVPFLES